MPKPTIASHAVDTTTVDRVVAPYTGGCHEFVGGPVPPDVHIDSFPRLCEMLGASRWWYAGQDPWTPERLVFQRFSADAESD